MCDNKMKIEFLGKSQNESFARVAVADFVSQLDPTIEEITDIKTAVSEAVTNSIIHAYESNEACFSIVTRTSSGGLMFLTSTRVTFTPHLSVASSRIIRSFALI